MSGEQPAPGSICVGCGLCCNGTLHRYTKVKEEDEAAVAGIGLEVLEVEGGRSFRQPCRHFSSGRCGVYHQRPPVCSGYECSLLESVKRQELSVEEANAKIDRAQDLIATVQRMGPEAATASRRAELTESLKSRLAETSGAERSELAKKLLEIAALDHFLLRWFHKKKAAEQARAGAAEPASPSHGIESLKG